MKDKAAFKRTYAATGSMRKAALAAGYSEHRANMGKRGIAKELVRYTESRDRRLALSRGITPDQQEHFVRGTLIEQAIDGEGPTQVRAAELLGKDKRVSMFNDSHNGNISINLAILTALDSDPRVLSTRTLAPSSHAKELLVRESQNQRPPVAPDDHRTRE